MIDPAQLLSDTFALISILALPPLAFGILFLLAYDQGFVGEAMGFGKRTFLLLVVAVAVGWLANIPFFYYHGSIMAINVGGALLPIAISLALLGGRILPGKFRELGAVLGSLGIATFGLLVVGVVLPTQMVPPRELLPFLAAFAAAAVGLVLLRRTLLTAHPGVGLDAFGAFALIGLGMFGTYLATEVVQGQGIESAFPAYLVMPFTLGAVSVALRWPRRDAPALAYATATLGCLIGADVLHQPQLFTGPPFLGAIGGAGPEDLVFLSGLFALTVAFALDLAVHGARSRQLVEHPGPTLAGTLRPPDSRFTDALRDYAGQSYVLVPQKVVDVVDSGIAEARSALGLPPTLTDRALEGLTTHPLFQADLQNLRSLAGRGAKGRDDARRALVTGFLLQRGLLELLSRRFATSKERVQAYAIDLLLTFAPAVPLLFLVLALEGLTTTALAADSIIYEGALTALGAWPYVLFVLTEARWGATPGKILLGLEVVGPAGSRPSFLALLSRNVPKVVPLEILSIAVGLAVPISIDPTFGPDGPLTAVLLVIGGICGVLLAGFASTWAMRITPRRQRLGDLVAGTMVWKRIPRVNPGPTPPWGGTPLPSVPRSP